MGGDVEGAVGLRPVISTRPGERSRRGAGLERIVVPVTVDVNENVVHGLGVGDDGDDHHFGATPGAQERIELEEPAEQPGPGGAAGRVMSRAMCSSCQGSSGGRSCWQ